MYLYFHYLEKILRPSQVRQGTTRLSKDVRGTRMTFNKKKRLKVRSTQYIRNSTMQHLPGQRLLRTKLIRL